MKHRYLILLLLPMLLILGCDRFEHSFTPPAQTDYALLVFTPLEDALNSTEEPVVKAMEYFTEDYLHTGVSRTERQLWLQGLYNANENLIAEASLISSSQISPTAANINWRLLLLSSERGIIADSTFIGDKLIKQDGQWLIHGNQVSCITPGSQQTVVLEYFTFQGCPNCPPAEAKLHELQQLHGDRLIYLEHHITGPLMVNGDPTYPYYAPGAVPVTMFQGMQKVSGSGSDALDAYEPIVSDLLQAAEPVRYKNLTYSVDARTISGSVKLESTSGTCNQTDLYLCVVLIEKTSSYTNTQGANLHNVVRGKSIIDLREADLTQPTTFSVLSASDIPDDMSLVVFAQRRPASFENNATILGGIEIPITR